VLGGADRLVSVNAEQMPAEIMLAAEGAATGAVGADMGLETIGVVGSHVSLEIVSASESWKG
jgi:hypothetical protein